MVVKVCFLLLVEFSTFIIEIHIIYCIFQTIRRTVPPKFGRKGGAHLVDQMSVSYTHLTLPTKQVQCRSRWAPDH